MSRLSISQNLTRININLENIRALLNILLDERQLSTSSSIPSIPSIPSTLFTRPNRNSTTRDNIEISFSNPIPLDLSNIFGSLFPETNTTSIVTHNTVMTNTTIETVDNNIDERCSICHDSYNENNVIRRINCCGHFFHCNCVDTWLATHITCPICRRDIRTNNDNNNNDNNNNNDTNNNDTDNNNHNQSGRPIIIAEERHHSSIDSVPTRTNI